MSAKLQNRPPLTEREPFADDQAVDQADMVLSRIRRIQVDAEQICNDAADIEDARFLATNIANNCQRILAHQAGMLSDARAGKRPADAARLLAVTTAVRKSNGRRATPPGNGLASLSARELEIFTLLAEGYSAAEIASMLSRSSKTINNHRTRILQKLGLRNATELVRLALHSGLISV